MNSYSLLIIKPGFLKNKNEIEKTLSENSIKILKEKVEQIDVCKLQAHYKEHEGKSFYEKLLKYMAKGEVGSVKFDNTCCVMIATSADKNESEEHFIKRSREVVSNIIRPNFALKREDFLSLSEEEFAEIKKTANVLHASDCDESAKREIKNMFPNFELTTNCVEK